MGFFIFENKLKIMGADAKLFVACDENKSNEVYKKVTDAINIWQRELLDKYCEEKSFQTRVQFLFLDRTVKTNLKYKEWSNGIYEINTINFDSFNMYFKINGEPRKLFCTHTCSNDYSETYKGEKIIFSLGCWGMSDEIMKVVGEACKEFGDVYYDFNDSDDKDFVKL